MKSLFTSIISSEPFTFIKGALVFFIGPLSLQLAYFLIVILIDLFFGIQVARKEKQFSWKILFAKVKKKMIFYSLMIALFHALDMITGLPDTARISVVILLAGMEVLSTIKNTGKLGHQKVSLALEQLYMSLIRPQLPAAKNTEKENSVEDELVDKSEKGGTVEDGSKN